MKIVFITSRIDHGGSSIIAEDLTQGFSNRGHDVLFICTGERTEKYSGKYRIQILSNRYRMKIYHYFNPFLIKKLYGILKHFKPDIINVHNINLQTFSLCTLLFSRLFPLAWTLHDLWVICMVGWPDSDACILDRKKCGNCSIWPVWVVRINRFIKEWVYKHSRLSVICPSIWLKKTLEGSIVDQGYLSVINNGINETVFYPLKDPMPVYSKSSNYKTLLFCGGKRVDERSPAIRKGWNDLSIALAILSGRRNDIRLLYVGDPINTPDYPVPIRFVGGVSREDMNQYYNESDIFLLPTLADNSPLTIIEAMACKVPVVASDVGGVAEMVIHYQTGLLCEPGNPNSLAMAIELMVSNDIMRRKMGEQAYLRFKEKFCMERMIDNYELCFQNTIDSWGKSKQRINQG